MARARWTVAALVLLVATAFAYWLMAAPVGPRTLRRFDPDRTPKLGLGKVYASKGETEKAIQTFREVAASAKPGSPEAAEADAFLKELTR